MQLPCESLRFSSIRADRANSTANISFPQAMAVLNCKTPHCLSQAFVLFLCPKKVHWNLGMPWKIGFSEPIMPYHVWHICILMAISLAEIWQHLGDLGGSSWQTNTGNQSGSRRSLPVCFPECYRRIDTNVWKPKKMNERHAVMQTWYKNRT